MSAVSELRALRANATSGPWVKPFDDGAICSADAPNESLLALDKDGMAIFDKPADAALVVALRNNVDALIDLADAAQRLVERSASIDEKHPAYGFLVMAIPLAKALAKLGQS